MPFTLIMSPDWLSRKRLKVERELRLGDAVQSSDWVRRALSGPTLAIRLTVCTAEILERNMKLLKE
jgi:hypothetical protein